MASASATIPVGYKQTEVGVIPEDWMVKPIGELLQFKNGLNKAKEFFGFGTPIINYMDVFSYSGISADDIEGKVSVTAQEQLNYSARKGDVFFTRTSETVEEIGISAVLLDDLESGVFSGFVLRGSPISNLIIPEFSKYCYGTHSVRKQIVSTASYTTRALTNGRLLSMVNTIIPSSKEEQKQISISITESEILIKSIENLIAKKRDIKQGTMQELLTGKTRLPGFTEEWQSIELSEIGMVFSGSSAPQKPAYFIQGTHPFVRVSDMTAENREVTLASSRDHVNNKCVKECNLVLAKKGTIIFPKSGASVANNNRAILSKDCYVVSHLAAIYSTTNCNDFIFHKLCMVDMMDYVGDPGYPSLSISEIRKIKLNIPKSVEEQEKISEILSDMGAEITALKQRLEKTKAIKQGMMQQLLTGRIRLVDPSSPVEASA